PLLRVERPIRVTVLRHLHDIEKSGALHVIGKMQSWDIRADGQDRRMQHLANMQIKRTVERRQLGRRYVFAANRYPPGAKKQRDAAFRMAVLDIVINDIVTLGELAKEFAKGQMLPGDPLDRLLAMQSKIEAYVQFAIIVFPGLPRAAVEQRRVPA